MNASTVSKLKRFFSAGVFVAVFQFGFFWVLFNVLYLDYLVASLISFVVTVLVSFVMQSKFVFVADEERAFATSTSVSLMYVNAVLGLGINIIIMYVGVEMIYNLAELWQVVSMFVLACYNYIVYSYIFKTNT